MSQLCVLFEHATGYALFRVQQTEEIGMFLPHVEAGADDFSRVQSKVKLIGFIPFKSAANALDNLNCISEGVLHEDLNLFLDQKMPKAGKKETVMLGVADPKLGGTITETLKISCTTSGVVPEVIREIRGYFPKLLKGFTNESVAKAQLGLGHSYSRCKVKFNVHRVDNMIIQSISLLEQLDKDINTFSMRIREWYSYHFPELIKIVPENYLFAKMAKYIGNRKELNEEKVSVMEEMLMDGGRARAILDASKSSMGMDISPIDLLNIQTFAARVVSLAEYRTTLQEYLKDKMSSVAPNLSALIGENVGAKLISHAGSLTNLAKYPASTVQILGAEKALFRALKTRGNTPKYGLIFHSTFIGRAATKNKGRISRYLANKCSIASRIDCFSEVPTNIFGEKLRDQVEERLKYYETGEIPRKNIDVMQEAIQDVSVEVKQKKKKKNKNKKKNKEDSLVEDGFDTTVNDDSQMHEDANDSVVKKKKKKRKHNESVNGDVPNEASVKKHKKK